ncbi:Hypothetical predicted protein [Olea europaea subsp. europaea]|uniref:Uncharacterized protein n=1 Tax=Olea europaea subsp. europaea TaxID=158383 RepID=A0A8S0SCV5_OLEEU|nr:Hypothetical predicted protein [Olea europaea subsp. europaea]
MAKRSSFGNMVRRRRSDITNSLPNAKSSVIMEKFPSDSAPRKDYIDRLVKENVGLVKLIQDKKNLIWVKKVENTATRTGVQGSCFNAKNRELKALFEKTVRYL